MVCITEPPDESPKSGDDENSRTPDDKSKSQTTPTITEENEVDENTNHKSSLSLPVELPPSGEPTSNSRRKLSVQGLMAFAERRRSSVTTFADLRKMSITNGDGIHIRTPGGTGEFSIFFFKKLL